ncbi:BRO family protein [Bacillus paramobilis]|uniref:BRO-N domain-containing protein n=1 Tax=Bacillus paramobilis TaxID=2817477 RepID=UPI003D1C04C2
MSLQVVHQQDVLGQPFKVYGSIEEPLFLANDVAHWLEYKGGVSLLMKSVDEEEKGLYNVNTLGGSQKNWFLTEDGIYEVLMQSRKPIVILLLNNLIRYYYSNTRVDLLL